MGNSKNFKFSSIDGAILRAIREFYNITGEILAKYLGFANKSTISKMENSNKPIRHDIVEGLFRLLVENQQIHSEEQFSDQIMKFKKNLKFESSLQSDKPTKTLQDEPDIIIPPYGNDEYRDKLLKQTDQEKRKLELELKEKQLQNFEFLRKLDSIGFEVDRMQDSFEARISVLESQVSQIHGESRKTLNSFDDFILESKLNFTSIRDDISKINKIIDEITVDVAEGSQSNSSGLSGLIEKYPFVIDMLSGVSSQVGDTVGKLLNKALSKMGGLEDNSTGISTESPGFNPIEDDSRIGMNYYPPFTPPYNPPIDPDQREG